METWGADAFEMTCKGLHHCLQISSYSSLVCETLMCFFINSGEFYF